MMPTARRPDLGPRIEPAGDHRRRSNDGSSEARSPSSSRTGPTRRGLADAPRRGHRDGVVAHRGLRLARRVRRGARRASCASTGRSRVPRRVHAAAGPVFVDAFPAASSTSIRRCCRRFPASTRQRQALEHGVKVAGCTVHLVTAELDAGPIVLQAQSRAAGRHRDTLAARILVEEHRVYPGSDPARARRRLAHGRAAVCGPFSVVSC